MVHKKPRFGGGIKMDHNRNSKSASTGQEFGSMEKSATKNVHEETDSLLYQTGGYDTLFGESILKTTSDVIVESNQTLSQQEENHREEFSPTTGQTSQINEGHTENREKGVKNDALVVARLKETVLELTDLIDDFETLGITAKPKLYSKLRDDQKQLWFRYFDDIMTEKLSDKFQFLQDGFSDPDLPSSASEIVYCKNLFLKDRKGQFYFVITEESCSVDLKLLKQQLNVSRNLSFVDEQSLYSILKLKPGEVTPFAIRHSSAQGVRVIFHESLSKIVDTNVSMAFHPLCPFLQIEVTFSQLSLYLSHHRNKMEILSQDKEIACVTKKQNDTLKLTSKHKGNEVSLKHLHSSQSSQVSFGADGVICHTEEKTTSRCSDKKISATAFLRPTTAKDEACVSSPYEAFLGKEAAKQTKKIIVKNYERKGKLKSYIKKNAGHSDKSVINETENGSLARPLLDANRKGNQQSIKVMTQGPSNEEIVITNDLKDKQRRVANLNALSPKVNLPEIDDFYKSLSIHEISFRELDVALKTSKDIGAAIGARCFLLKDRNKVRNYFLIVCHELYELDYGRLKKALHPKKRLDECDADEVMDILGVDQQHLTPFAVMNVRAGRNNVCVFFTEKIMASNIVLCIQHPFAVGNRILLTSGTLQCLLEKFSSDGAIGVVEEKVWAEKYNQIFSQFQFSKFNHISGMETTARMKCPKLSEVNVQNKRNEHPEMLTGDEKEKTQNPTDLTNCGVYSSFKHNFHKFLNQVIISVGLYLPLTYAEPQSLDGACWVVESPVDQEDFKHNRNNVACSSHLETNYELIKESVIKCRATKIQGSINETLLCHGQTGRIREYGVPHIPEQELELEQSKDSSNETTNPLFRALIEKEKKLSVNDIQQHLDENDIDYHISVRKDVHGNDNDEDDDDKTSQMCHTLHLMDEFGENHYIIVGRESEHQEVP